MDHRSLARFAWLSVAAALVTIGLKVGAYLLTGSVGLLSDALESAVNLLGGLLALAAVAVAARPPDEDHAYGHEKAEYFSSGAEGALILLAAIGIALTAADRLLHPRAVEQVGWGLAVSALAALVNLGVARRLLRAGREHDSIALEADARHLLTDVWTTVGVLAGVAAVALTGLGWLDPLVALAVAANIVREGLRLVRRALLGLLDTGLPAAERAAVRAVLARYRRAGVASHALRTRQAGARRFVSLHLLVPGDWSVRRGHALADEIEREIRAVVPRATVFTHLEPAGDPASWEDAALDRQAGVADERSPTTAGEGPAAEWAAGH